MTGKPADANGANGVNGVAKWTRFASIAAPTVAAFLGICSILWYVFGIADFVRVQGTLNSGYERRLAASEATVVALTSKLDLLSSFKEAQEARNSDVYRRLDQAEARIATGQVAVAEMRRDLNEIETQFCAEDSVRNLTHASDLRWIAVIYEKAFGQPFPKGDAYYAVICNRDPRKKG